MFASSMSDQLKYWMQNPICKVVYAGFTSDTYTLQRNGWDLSARQALTPWASEYQIEIVMHHRNSKMYALTYPVALRLNDLYQFDFRKIQDQLVFHVRCISSDIVIQSMGPQPMNYFSDFSAIDAEPMWAKTNSESIKDFKIFKPMVKTQEIVIGPKTVPEALEYILKLQDPIQKEIREKKRKEAAREQMDMNAKPEEEFVAQIISIAG